MDKTQWVRLLPFCLFMTFNVLGFYICSGINQNLIWIQVEFIQCYAILALLTKNEPGGELSASEFGSLVDIGSFTRLDFMSWFITKDLSRKGFDRFAIFGYDTDESIFWQGAIGPLNILMFLVILIPFAALMTIVGCKKMKLTKSRKINFAALAFLFSSFDRLFTHAQLHLLILTMFGWRD